MREMRRGGAGRVRTGSTQRVGATARTAARVGAMGERTWNGSRWTAPALVVWQVPVPRAGLPPIHAGHRVRRGVVPLEQAERGARCRPAGPAGRRPAWRARSGGSAGPGASEGKVTGGRTGGQRVDPGTRRREPVRRGLRCFKRVTTTSCLELESQLPLNAPAETPHHLHPPKGTVGEAAKFLFAPSDHAEGNVLENTVVGKKGKNKFRIVGCPSHRPIIEHPFYKELAMTLSSLKGRRLPCREALDRECVAPPKRVKLLVARPAPPRGRSRVSDVGSAPSWRAVTVDKLERGGSKGA